MSFFLFRLIRPGSRQFSGFSFRRIAFFGESLDDFVDTRLGVIVANGYRVVLQVDLCLRYPWNGLHDTPYRVCRIRSGATCRNVELHHLLCCKARLAR
jgi:hypothetical protein